MHIDKEVADGGCCKGLSYPFEPKLILCSCLNAGSVQGRLHLGSKMPTLGTQLYKRMPTTLAALYSLVFVCLMRWQIDGPAPKGRRGSKIFEKSFQVADSANCGRLMGGSTRVNRFDNLCDVPTAKTSLIIVTGHHLQTKTPPDDEASGGVMNRAMTALSGLLAG